MLNRLKLMLRRLLGGEGRARIHARVARVESRLVELQIQVDRGSAEAESRLAARFAKLLESQSETREALKGLAEAFAGHQARTGAGLGDLNAAIEADRVAVRRSFQPVEARLVTLDATVEAVRRRLMETERDHRADLPDGPSGSEGFAVTMARLDNLERRIDAAVERLRDVEVMETRGSTPDAWPPPFELETSFPVAGRSADHLHPRGTANDNTRSPRFVAACERLFQRPLRHLDLGCAGGGLVRDFLVAGHRSMGLEGSDYSLLAQRAEWRPLGARLRTCDITRPFRISDGGQPARFDVITAWEVLEHLAADDLAVFFGNVRDHLAADGLFVASVATFEDRDAETGAVWHVTIKPQGWWLAKIGEAGLKVVQSPFAVRDYARGSGTSSDDWDVLLNPELGFHLVAAL